MQKNGAGLHAASSCYWNNSTDESCTVGGENKTMYPKTDTIQYIVLFSHRTVQLPSVELSQ